MSNSDFNITLPDPDLTAPAAITDLTASDPTNSTINLTWTAPGDDDNTGTASFYDIRFATASITEAGPDTISPPAKTPLTEVSNDIGLTLNNPLSALALIC